MVLGLRSKNRRGVSVEVNYLVHVEEIKPWPPSQSLKSLQSVLLQWENGDQSSGSLSISVPSAASGNIVINQSFKLPVTLCKEKTHGKGKKSDNFQKNCLAFNLYEPRKDKVVKGQLLGTGIVNLAGYGIISETVSFTAPMNCKRSFRNTTQPVLFGHIQQYEKDNSSSSVNCSLSKEASEDKDGEGSVSESVHDECDEDVEIESFTDDDVSLYSSQTVASSALGATEGSLPENREAENVTLTRSAATTSGIVYTALPVEVEPTKEEVNPTAKEIRDSDGNSSRSSSTKLSSKLNDEENEKGPRQIRDDEEVVMIKNESYVNNPQGTERKEQHKNGTKDCDGRQIEDDKEVVTMTNNLYSDILQGNSRKEKQGNEKEQELLNKKNEPVSKIPQDALRNTDKLELELQDNVMTSEKRIHNVPFDSAKSTESPSSSELLGREDTYINAVKLAASKRKERRNKLSEDKTELEYRIKTLEEELKEAAAVEVGLYSVVAEHVSSTNKVHAPARRLSRFYLHASQRKSQTGSESAYRAAVSGLILVSKACGNDVPRLTFWLSNSIVLRAIVSQSMQYKAESDGPSITGNGSGTRVNERVPSSDSLSRNDESNDNSIENSEDWDDLQTFTGLLEKFEAWIFSRIVESVWWQTMTPHMQSAAAKTSARVASSSLKKAYGQTHCLGDLEQGSFSVDLWKKAFQDACERLCPIRAGGHECGCLPVLARLVMKQLVNRLDVAMFNALLRESADEMPTDPVSDPISDSKVLPIPAGKASFGAGAQLKNAIGNWSRWLTDLFGIDENDAPEDRNAMDNEQGVECETSFKPFHLLNALSDLMMLPKEAFADSLTRKEVCPTFSAPLIKRVLESFVPDEFSPEPIPESILESLNSEEADDSSEATIASFPCMASPIVYSPPPPPSLSGIVGDLSGQVLLRSGSSILRKSYTSDDELDELDSPLKSVLGISLTSKKSKSVGNGGRSVIRYQLLRQVWKDAE